MVPRVPAWAVAAVMLLTGSMNTLSKKAMFETCAPSITGHTRADCPSGQEPFNKPWTQNLAMFLGESMLLFVVLYKQRQQYPASDRRPPRPPPYFFAPPAALDLLGTGFSGIGMNFISASVWQMMRGSIVVFTAILSVLLLGRTMHRSKIFAICCTVLGLALVGASSVLDTKSSSSSHGGLASLVGIGFTILGQLCGATQMITEERLLKSRRCPSSLVVGMEGIWGIASMLVVLAAMSWVPGDDNGSYENTRDSLYKLETSTTILTLMITYFLSISVFNLCGMTVARRLSSVHRTMLDSLRTMLVWIAQLSFYYIFGSSRYGTPWSAHSWLQLAGFLICVVGTLLYNDVIALPFMRAHDVDESSRALIMPADNDESDASAVVNESPSDADREMNSY
ncbi:hypothetical protein FOZ63_000164 [Perkinsus olseni]|uniref:EamA domain-containing protein n=1 Tax=Perkinsus olseni TaxID=32597 RepID=A0A7J6UNW2_PEROL|nr:hypothetical protein FOZ62_029649 [Perkinsus olseni]KAF4758716.1 hypothetical protein FOZ63_000164 [Perkinsus olseni]